MQIPKNYIYVGAGVVVLLLIVGLAVATGVVSTQLKKTAKEKEEMEKTIQRLEEAIENSVENEEELKLIQAELDSVKQELQECFSSVTPVDDKAGEGGTNLGLVVGLPIVFIVLGGAGYGYYYYVERVRGQGAFAASNAAAKTKKKKKTKQPNYVALSTFAKPVT